MLLWSIRLNGTPESLVVRNAKRPQEEYTFFHIRPYIYIASCTLKSEKWPQSGNQ